MKENIWIVGAGDMAMEYAKILRDMGKEFKVIGRNEQSAKRFEEATQLEVQRGGIQNYISNVTEIPEYAIVAVYPSLLKEVALTLISAGVKNILLEKPGAMSKEELLEIKKCASSKLANVAIAYNRRFYASVNEAKRVITEDGGVRSFNFEFTEWSHVIGQLDKPKDELENWFLANSTHVVDLAFYLGGRPAELSSYVSGKLDWYSRACMFSGAGKTKCEALFSYKANWGSAGRWSLEVLTEKHKLIFEPLEKLKMQDRGSINIYEVEIDDKIDKKYKAGLYLETLAFLDGDYSILVGIDEQIDNMIFYDVMQTTGKIMI